MPVSVRQSVSSRGRLDRPPSQTYSRVDPTLRVGERTIVAIYSKKKRRLAEQTAASLSVQGPDLDRSRLAVMTANDDPLDVRSACPFPGQMRREGLLGSASTPNWLSPSSRIGSVDPITRKCPEVMTRQCKKNRLPWQTNHRKGRADALVCVFVVGQLLLYLPKPPCEKRSGNPRSGNLATLVREEDTDDFDAVDGCRNRSRLCTRPDLANPV